MVPDTCDLVMDSIQFFFPGTWASDNDGMTMGVTALTMDAPTGKPVWTVNEQSQQACYQEKLKEEVWYVVGFQVIASARDCTDDAQASTDICLKHWAHPWTILDYDPTTEKGTFLEVAKNGMNVGLFRMNEAGEPVPTSMIQEGLAYPSPVTTLWTEDENRAMDGAGLNNAYPIIMEIDRHDTVVEIVVIDGEPNSEEVEYEVEGLPDLAEYTEVRTALFIGEGSVVVSVWAWMAPFPWLIVTALVLACCCCICACCYCCYYLLIKQPNARYAHVQPYYGGGAAANKPYSEGGLGYGGTGGSKSVDSPPSYTSSGGYTQASGMTRSAGGKRGSRTRMGSGTKSNGSGANRMSTGSGRARKAKNRMSAGSGRSGGSAAKRKGGSNSKRRSRGGSKGNKRNSTRSAEPRIDF